MKQIVCMQHYINPSSHWMTSTRAPHHTHQHKHPDATASGDPELLEGQGGQAAQWLTASALQGDIARTMQQIQELAMISRSTDVLPLRPSGPPTLPVHVLHRVQHACLVSGSTCTFAPCALSKILVVSHDIIKPNVGNRLRCMHAACGQ